MGIMVTVIRRSSKPSVRPNKHQWKKSGRYRTVRLIEELPLNLIMTLRFNEPYWDNVTFTSIRLINPFGNTVYLYYSPAMTSGQYVLYDVEAGQLRKYGTPYAIPGAFQPHFSQLAQRTRK